MLAPLVVEQRLASMFRYRHDTLRADLIDHGRYEARPRLSVAMTGASGLLGSALRAFLTTGGHRVIRLVRRPSSEPDTFTWDVERGIHAPERLPAIDAAIHFAGESIAGGRWTERRKAGIRHSRVTGTQTLATSLARLASPPKALLCASAIGFYGSRSDEVTEQDGPGQGFLAEVCREWEAAAGPAVRAGIRVVHLRIGLVLSPAGGLLALLLPLFRAGLGGPVGSGTQGISWIGLDDVVGAFHHALQTETLWGPVNATAPTPVSSREFATTLGHVLGRPAVLPAPALGVKLIMGSEMATETALSGARVLPERLLASGLAFRHRTLAEGLRHVLGK